jgi:hypothetical integral membrane protein (TIGR02206 family)
MNEFFALNWSGMSFELFGRHHLIALGLILVANVTLIIWGRRLSERWRLGLRYGLAAILIVDEIGWHYWNWVTGQWSIQTTLPLHLCSVLVFLSALMLVTKSYGIFEYAYLLGIAGALQALLTPDAGAYGFPHFRFFQVFVSHGSIVTAAVYMAVVERYRPTVKSIKNVVIGANLYMIAVGIVNALIGSNYLYIAHKPETASLLDVLPPWPWYIPILELLGILMIGLLYLPYAIVDMKSQRTAMATSPDAIEIHQRA